MFHDAHRGSLRLQSAQTLFSGCLTSARRIRAFASVCALGCVCRAYDIAARGGGEGKGRTQTRRERRHYLLR